jgi:hypothetical protein
MIIIPNTNYYAIIASRETENMIPEQNTFITEDEKNKMIV